MWQRGRRNRNTMPRYSTRATSTSKRLSFRCRAIGPPASKVLPLTLPSPFAGDSLPPPGREKGAGPDALLFRPAGHPVCSPIPPHRKERLQPHASRRQKRPALLRPRLAVAMPKTMSCQRLPARRDPRFCKMGTAAWLAVQRSGILQEAIAKPDGRETPGGSWGLPRWGPFVRVIGSVYFG